LAYIEHYSARSPRIGLGSKRFEICLDEPGMGLGVVVDEDHKITLRVIEPDVPCEADIGLGAGGHDDGDCILKIEQPMRD